MIFDDGNLFRMIDASLCTGTLAMCLRTDVRLPQKNTLSLLFFFFIVKCHRGVAPVPPRAFCKKLDQKLSFASGAKTGNKQHKNHRPDLGRWFCFTQIMLLPQSNLPDRQSADLLSRQSAP